MSGPVLQAHIIRYLGNNGIEIEILSTTTKERTSWVDAPVEKPLRGGVASQRSRTQFHKF